MGLQILGVGTGRDGTASLTEIINRIYALNGIDIQVKHEYATTECYANFCEFKETGKHKYLGYVERLIRDCPYGVAVGNGYAFVLELIAGVCAGHTKLIHIKRADRETCIRSIAENVRLFPLSHRYYSDSDDAQFKRATAFHTGEMTREAWDAMPLNDRIGWYYDATHKLIEKAKHLFVESISVSTEEISSPECLARLTQFVLGRRGIVPQPAHLNRYSPIEYKHLPIQDRSYLHFCFREVEVNQAAVEDVYLVRHFNQCFMDWWYHILGHRDDFPQKDDAYLARVLDQAGQEFAKRYQEVQHARNVLAQLSHR
jgi:hypothetical protein